MNKYIFMRGYLLNNSKKIKAKNLKNKLLENNEALIYFDSKNNCVHFQENCKYNSLTSSFLEDISILLTGEMLFLQEYNNSFIILLYPIIVNFENNTSITLRIFLRVFENDAMIVTIETNTNVDVGYIMNGKITNVETANENYINDFNKIGIMNFLNIFDFIVLMLNKYITLSAPISRNFFIIDKKKMSLKEVTKSLCQTNLDFKTYKPLKDFRGLTDYYHFANELSSVVYGNYLKDAHYRLLMLDHFVIYLILKDFWYYKKINSYGLKKLYEIKNTYEYSYATLKYAQLVEDNNYINYVLRTQNKQNLSKVCASAIDKKIELKNNRFQIVLTILGLLFAIPTLIEFFINGNLNKIIDFLKKII